MTQGIRKAVLIVIAVALLLGVASFVVDRVILDRTYARIPSRTATVLATYAAYEGEYPRTPVEFNFSEASSSKASAGEAGVGSAAPGSGHTEWKADGTTLRGYVYGPDNTRGLIIFRHGIFSQHEDYLPLIIAMVDKGWKVFAYDALGCGISDGNSVRGFSQSPLDVEAALSFARESGMADGMKVALWGHSWGGYGVAAALANCPDVDACVTMSGFDSPLGILENATQSMAGPLAITQYPTLWLNTFVEFGADGNRSASRAVIDSRVPTLVIHGSDDQTVPLAGVSVLDNVERAKAPHVTTMVLDEPGRNGHNTYFYSPESQALLNDAAAQLEELLATNGENPDAPAVRAFLGEQDIRALNTADPALMSQIDTFLAS